MSHIFLFGGVKIGSNTAFHCFVLQRKLIYSIKYVLEKRSSSYHKEVQRIPYRQRTGKSLLPNAKGFKL